MPDPTGTLTAAQHEILEVVWGAGQLGATVAEIWGAIGAHRRVTRTTVLNQVDRLEKRGWLKRYEHADGFRYVARKPRQQVASGLALEFVDSFFGGSASELVMSLLGSRKLSTAEISKLKALLETRLSHRKHESS
jgi:BlaI family transcriptional regulator, penicillinase repressor